MTGAARFEGRVTLVTGGAGFIGSHLVERLLEEGARVRVLDDFSSGRRENLAAVRERIEVLEGDVRDPAMVQRGCRGVAVVFHQAALGSVPRSLERPAETLSVNVEGTVRLLEACRDAGVRRCVYASSSSVYGDADELPKREGGEGRALSPYALSKQMTEQVAELFGRCYRLEVVGLRYFNVYGPRQDPAGPYAAVIPRFFAASLRDEPPVVYGDGSQTRDFTFVDDVVEANLRAATAPAASCGRAYNVARGEQTTVTELAERVREVVGSGRRPRHAEPRAGDVPHSRADVSAALEALGFRARVPLAEGLERSREHYRRSLPT